MVENSRAIEGTLMIYQLEAIHYPSPPYPTSRVPPYSWSASVA